MALNNGKVRCALRSSDALDIVAYTKYAQNCLV
jgi:hypothetical protein